MKRAGRQGESEPTRRAQTRPARKERPSVDRTAGVGNKLGQIACFIIYSEVWWPLMPRPVRIECPQATYHVMSRGRPPQPIIFTHC